MKILSVHEGVVPISSSIRNAWIDFSSMDCSIVAIVSDVVRDGEPVVGLRVQLQRPLQRRGDPAPSGAAAPARRRAGGPARRGRRPRPAPGVGLHDAQREAGRARRALGRGRRGRHGAVRPGRQARRAAAVPLPVRPLRRRPARRLGVRLRRRRLLRPGQGPARAAGRDARVPRPGLPRGQDEDRRRGPGRGPAPHRGGPRGPRRRRLPPGRRRQRPVRPGHRAGVRQGHRALRPVLVRGGRRPAGLRPQRHAVRALQRPASRPGRTCSPCRTPAT